MRPVCQLWGHCADCVSSMGPVRPVCPSSGLTSADGHGQYFLYSIHEWPWHQSAGFYMCVCSSHLCSDCAVAESFVC